MLDEQWVCLLILFQGTCFNNCLQLKNLNLSIPFLWKRVSHGEYRRLLYSWKILTALFDHVTAISKRCPFHGKSRASKEQTESKHNIPSGTEAIGDVPLAELESAVESRSIHFSVQSHNLSDFRASKTTASAMTTKRKSQSMSHGSRKSLYFALRISLISKILQQLHDFRFQTSVQGRIFGRGSSFSPWRSNL